MKTYGRTNLAEFLGDRVVYRNLAPADPRLPGLAEAAARAGLPDGRIPRKVEADYARVVVHLLKRAQELRGVGRALSRLLFVGDTRLLDGTAFANVCVAGNWPGLAFIGAENAKPPTAEIEPNDSGQSIYVANRWAALGDFAAYAASSGFPVDEATAVILDIDKTCLGARGRNGQVIDAARVRAVQETVAALLGPAFELEPFRAAYTLLNEPEFHPFTGDNQDYLAYVCLILGSGLYRLETVVADIREKRLASFEQFITGVDAERRRLPVQLAVMHAEIFGRVQAGDPTPFKSFRRNEYLVTIGCFGQLDDASPAEKLLAEEIVITQEVRTLALDWQKRGALIFGLSDKPDEAATPTPELAARGYLPIHQAKTHTLGE